MPTSCIALGCNERSNKKSDPSITFHQLPKDPGRREKWILAQQRGNYKPGKQACLCSKHFAPEDFDRTSISYVRIREDAVPSLFLAFPAHPHKKTNKRKTPKPHNLCEDTEIAEFNRKDSDKEKPLDHIVQENSNSVLGLEHEFDMESQHDNEPTLELKPEGDIAYIKEEKEDEYYEMGYEGAPVLNADVKSEFGNGYDGRGETEMGDFEIKIEIKEEAIELKEEPSEMQEKRGEKRPVHSPPPSFSNSKKQRTEVADEYEDTLWLVDFNPKEESSSVEKDSDSGHEQHDAEETEDEYDGTKDAGKEDDDAKSFKPRNQKLCKRSNKIASLVKEYRIYLTRLTTANRAKQFAERIRQILEGCQIDNPLDLLDRETEVVLQDWFTNYGKSYAPSTVYASMSILINYLNFVMDIYGEKVPFEKVQTLLELLRTWRRTINKPHKSKISFENKEFSPANIFTFENSKVTKRAYELLERSQKIKEMPLTRIKHLLITNVLTIKALFRNSCHPRMIAKIKLQAFDEAHKECEGVNEYFIIYVSDHKIKAHVSLTKELHQLYSVYKTKIRPCIVKNCRGQVSSSLFLTWTGDRFGSEDIKGLNILWKAAGLTSDIC